MTESSLLQPEDRPQINPNYLLRWEETQNAWLLLYPEGVIKLNQSAAEILKLCTGAHTIDGMIEALRVKFDGGGGEHLDRNVYTFLETIHAKGWIRSR